MDGALVGLVDDDYGVPDKESDKEVIKKDKKTIRKRLLGERGVQQRLAQQHAVGAELEPRGRRGHILKPDAIPH